MHAASCWVLALADGVHLESLHLRTAPGEMHGQPQQCDACCMRECTQLPVRRSLLLKPTSSQRSSRWRPSCAAVTWRPPHRQPLQPPLSPSGGGWVKLDSRSWLSRNDYGAGGCVERCVCHPARGEGSPPRQLPPIPFQPCLSRWPWTGGAPRSRRRHVGSPFLFSCDATLLLGLLRQYLAHAVYFTDRLGPPLRGNPWEKREVAARGSGGYESPPLYGPKGGKQLWNRSTPSAPEQSGSAASYGTDGHWRPPMRVSIS